jgi:serine/threonine protein kinase
VNSPPPSRPNTAVIGRYEVLEELGRGAMGVVLLAQDPILGRRVALKYLRPDLKLDPDERELLMKRMNQEARAIARIVHPGIVALHDMGVDPKLGAYLVFEHAKGRTLQSVLMRGRLTREGSARLARELGDALDAAHAHSVVHRDIKPGNIILTEEGSKVADFGVARLPDSTLTKAGARVGTPAYSAPESIREGEHSERSDQFSMAACLYEGISGRRAYPGEDAVKVARSIEKEPPLPISEALGLSPRVDEVLLKAMSLDPRRRYSSCREFGLALSDALLGVREGLPTLPESHATFHVQPIERHRSVGSAVLWLLVGATVATAVFKYGLAPAGVPLVRSVSDPAPRPAYISPLPKKK